MSLLRIRPCYQRRPVPKAPLIGFTNGNAVGKIDCQWKATGGIVGNSLNNGKCSGLYSIKFKIDLESSKVALTCTT